MITMHKPEVSVIIPVYNEFGTIRALLKRLEESLLHRKERYELIFVDDRSTDGSLELMRTISETFPMVVMSKVGKKGKAASILEGSARAQDDILGFIDADLQYPPEALPGMYEASKEADIVVANRSVRSKGYIRTALSRLYKYLFGTLLLGIQADIQSGLKLFRREYLSEIRHDTGPWGLDYVLLFHAKNRGAKIVSYDIYFDERTYGESNVHIAKTGLELMVGALKLRIRYFWNNAFRAK